MKLQRIKCAHFSRAYDFTISEKYIVGCTGRRAKILDRNLNLIADIDGLDYVYSARFSPDEKKLLLISNGNIFYTVDMETCQKNRKTVKKPYDYNIEGRGCWSHDGKNIFIPVMNTQNLMSTLRCYNSENTDNFYDLLVEKYVIKDIYKLENSSRYLIIGFVRKGKQPYYAIYFDGEQFEEYLLQDTAGDIVFNSDVNNETGVITLYLHDTCCLYKWNGEKIHCIHFPKEIGYVEKLAQSSCGKYVYAATENGFYILDSDTKKILAEAEEEHGAQNCEELEKGLVAVATWGGVKIYEIIE